MNTSKTLVSLPNELVTDSEIDAINSVCAIRGYPLVTRAEHPWLKQACIVAVFPVSGDVVKDLEEEHICQAWHCGVYETLLALGKGGKE